MAVNGASRGTGAAAAAAQAEAQRRAEEARQRAEAARKAAEAAQKAAAEAAQKAAAQQQQKEQLQSEAQKLGEKLQSHKADPKVAEEAAHTGARIETQEARAQKDAAEQAGRELTRETTEQGGRAAGGAGLGSQLKDALASNAQKRLAAKREAQGAARPEVATLEAKQKKEDTAKQASEARHEAKRELHEAQRAQTRSKQQQHAANEADGKANRARDQQQDTQKRLDRVNDRVQKLEDKDGLSRGERQQLDRARDKVDTLEAKNRAQDRKADTLESAAHAEQRKADHDYNAAKKETDQAIQSMKDTNAAARSAGKKEAFKGVDEIRDTADAGSLTDKQQKKIFGTQLNVRTKDAVESDIDAAQEAANQGRPDEAAAILRESAENSDDPVYREQLIRQSNERGVIQQITEGIGSQDVSQEQANNAIRDLSRAADTLPGDGALMVSDHLIEAQRKDYSVTQKFTGALKANKGDPAVARVGVNVIDGSEGLAYQDDFKKANPDIDEVAKRPTGNSKANEALNVDGADDKRGKTEADLSRVYGESHQEADRLFGLDPKDSPKNTDIERNGNKVTVTRRDDEGHVIERTQAMRDGDKVSIDTTTYGKKGQAERNIVSSSPNETVVQHAKFDAKGTDKKNPPSIEELKNSREKGVEVNEARTRREANGDLVQDRYAQSKEGGVSGSHTVYSQQNGGKGIDDKLEGKFNKDEPIRTIEARSYNIPPPGSDQKPTYTRTRQFSQENVSATSEVSRPLSGDKIGSPPNAQDLNHVREANKGKEDFDGDKKYPKQWKLEVSKDHKYESQTFVEGHPDASVITTRKVNGNQVREEVRGKTFDPKGSGKLVDVNLDTDVTYDRNGQVRWQRQQGTGPDGSTIDQEYKREVNRNKRGQLEVTETTESRSGDNFFKQETTTRKTSDGWRLVQANNVYHERYGPTVTASIDEKGHKEVTYGGYAPQLRPQQTIKSEDQLKNLEVKEDADVIRASSDALDIQTKLANRSSAPGFAGGVEGGKPGEPVPGAPDALGHVKAGADSTQAGLNSYTSRANGTKLTPREQGLLGPRTVLGGTSGALGLIGGGLGFAQGIREGNFISAGQGLASATSGAASLAGTGYNYAASTAPTAAAESGHASTAKFFGRVSTAAGVVSSGLDIVGGFKADDGYQVLKGTIGLGSTIASTAIAGSAGGPAGVAIAVGIAGGTYLISKGLDALSDKEHDIGEVKIG